MRRRPVVWIVPLLLLAGLVTGLNTGLAGPAQAAQLTGGGLVSGQAVTAPVTTAGDSIAYTFSGTSGQHVDFVVEASSWSTDDGAALSWYRPDGSLLDQCYAGYVSQTPQPCTTTLDATGTWTLGVEPADSGTGQLTFTYLTDQDLGTLAPATAVTTTLSTPGRNAIYRFAGTAGRRVIFNVTAFALGTGGSARLGFTAPGATTEDDYCVLTKAPDVCTYTPGSTGTWAVSLEPTDSDTGSVSFAYGLDQVGGALAAGKAASATIATANQDASYTFTATKGRPVTVTVGAADWTSKGAGYLYFFAPGATALTSHCSATAGVNCRLTPSSSGTWRLTVAATTGTGHATFTYLPDVNKGKLVKGAKTTTRISTAGQNATYTFAATKGRKATFKVTSSRWSKGAVVRLWVTPPSGSPLFDSCTVTKRTMCTTVPNGTGTWRVELDPQGKAVGSLTMVRT